MSRQTKVRVSWSAHINLQTDVTKHTILQNLDETSNNIDPRCSHDQITELLNSCNEKTFKMIMNKIEYRCFQCVAIFTKI